MFLFFVSLYLIENAPTKTGAGHKKKGTTSQKPPAKRRRSATNPLEDRTQKAKSATRDRVTNPAHPAKRRAVLNGTTSNTASKSSDGVNKRKTLTFTKKVSIFFTKPNRENFRIFVFLSLDDSLIK